MKTTNTQSNARNLAILQIGDALVKILLADHYTILARPIEALRLLAANAAASRTYVHTLGDETHPQPETKVDIRRHAEKINVVQISEDLWQTTIDDELVQVGTLAEAIAHLSKL